MLTRLVPVKHRKKFSLGNVQIRIVVKLDLTAMELDKFGWTFNSGFIDSMNYLYSVAKKFRDTPGKQ